MNTHIEVAIRMPKSAPLKWVSADRFSSRVSKGAKVKCGEVIGVFNGAFNRELNVGIISPFDGEITFVSQVFYIDSKDDELLFRIKSDFQFTTNPNQIEQDVFQNLNRVCDEILQNRENLVIYERSNCITGAVMSTIVFGGISLIAFKTGGFGLLIGIFMLAFYIFALIMIKQQYDDEKQRLSLYPGKNAIKDALLGTASIHNL